MAKWPGLRRVASTVVRPVVESSAFLAARADSRPEMGQVRIRSTQFGSASNVLEWRLSDCYYPGDESLQRAGGSSAGVRRQMINPALWSNQHAADCCRHGGLPSDSGIRPGCSTEAGR